MTLRRTHVRLDDGIGYNWTAHASACSSISTSIQLREHLSLLVLMQRSIDVLRYARWPSHGLLGVYVSVAQYIRITRRKFHQILICSSRSCQSWSLLYCRDMRRQLGIIQIWWAEVSWKMDVMNRHWWCVDAKTLSGRQLLESADVLLLTYTTRHSISYKKGVQ
jgi:hypothetical protein